MRFGQWVQRRREWFDISRSRLASLLSEIMVRGENPMTEAHIIVIEEDGNIVLPPDSLIEALASVFEVDPDVVYIRASVLPPRLRSLKTNDDQIGWAMQRFTKDVLGSDEDDGGHSFVQPL